MTNTTSAFTTLTRRQIVNQAKDLVLFHGPYTVLEFGTELFWRTNVRATDTLDGDGRSDADAEAVTTEACKQAERVLRFLGR